MYQLVFRRYAPFYSFGGGFEGDDRETPSISLTEATGRTIGIVKFNRTSISNPRAYSDGTHYVGLGDTFRDFAGKHTATVSSQLSSRIISSNKISFTASTAGANPMIPSIPIGTGGGPVPYGHGATIKLAPDIDTFIDFKTEWLTTKANSIKFSGTVRGDTFPNLEVFVLDANDKGILLFDGRTAGGQTTGPLTHLPGSNSRKNLGQFSQIIEITADKGNFIGTHSCEQTTMEIFSSTSSPSTSQTDIRRGVYGIQRFQIV